MLPLYLYLQMVRRSSLLGLGLKTVGPVSCIFNVTWLAGDVKEPTHLSKRIGHLVPGVAARPCLTGWCFALHFAFSPWTE